MAEAIAPTLTAIFNASIDTGIFPDDFKIAIILPIHKFGRKTNCDNYRPISVLSSVAKIFIPLLRASPGLYPSTAVVTYNVSKKIRMKFRFL